MLTLSLLAVAKQIIPCDSTVKEISIEWSHHGISCTDSKFTTSLHVSIIDSGSERVKHRALLTSQQTPMVGPQSQASTCDTSPERNLIKIESNKPTQ